MHELAASYGVSVPSVREALRALERAGIISIEHGRGVFVRRVAPDSPPSFGAVLSARRLRMRALYEARLVLELGAAGLALERLHQTQVQAMRDAVAVMASPETDLEDLAKAEREFHAALIRNTGNPLLIEMAQALLDATAADLGVKQALIDGRTSAAQAHAEILEALEQKDITRLRVILHEHLLVACDEAEYLTDTQADSNQGDSNESSDG